jgi:hypothetical protein
MSEEIKDQLGLGVEYEFNNGEKYVVKPLGVQYFGHVVYLMNSFRKKFPDGKIDDNKVMELFAEDEKLMKNTSDMVSATINQMFPDKDDDFKKWFASRNMVTLISAVITENQPKSSSTDVRKNRLMEERMKMYDESVTENKG